MTNRVTMQIPLYPAKSKVRNARHFSSKDIGTFKDNLRTPVHNWFKYPAGYSHKFIEQVVNEFKLDKKKWLLDPFLGCGTTSVVAKQLDVNSFGIEAHLFVNWVAKTKVYWEFDLRRLKRNIDLFLHRTLKQFKNPARTDIDSYPDLVKKCYSKRNLENLTLLRDAIQEYKLTQRERDFFNLALTATLRESSKAGTGWPYIAPGKYHAKNEKPSFDVYQKVINNMYGDLTLMPRKRAGSVKTIVKLMDARDEYRLPAGSIDVAVTSPPYLNNYDYADRTRLEMYFFGWAKTWGEITRKVRDKLITAATTQIRRTEFEKECIDIEIRDGNRRFYVELKEKVDRLSDMRNKKGGKKSYDLMVAGYFNDIFRVLKRTHKVLKRNGAFLLILGDSAPYGVHIPTEHYIGILAKTIGFRAYDTIQLRTRGEKWARNPQRHHVNLKESILVLRK